MIILITGGSKSGKSMIAEKLAVSFHNKLYYIATMKPWGIEAYEAIERHRKMRHGKGFETIEKYCDINEITLSADSTLLIECIINLCANEMFDRGVKKPGEKIAGDIIKLSRKVKNIIAVTGQIGSDGISYHDLVENFIKELGIANCLVSKQAELVLETVFGIPVLMKGELPLCIS